MLSLLKEIRNAAVDADVPIANVLRKCAVLGTQLKNNDLRNWALQELNGYAAEIDVPEYRKIGAPLIGNLAGPFGSGYKNVPVPAVALPERLQDRARAVVFLEGVASLESHLEGEGEVMFTWPGDLIVWIQKEGKLSRDMVLYGAWQVVGRSAIVNIIDTVRNRVLEFCLRLEEEMPELMIGDSKPSPTPAAELAASQVFNQVFIFGPHTGNIANASPSTEQSVQIVKPGDLPGLTQALLDVGVPSGEVDALKTVIEEESEGGKKLGQKTGGWFKHAKQAVASGTWSLAKGATIATIKAAILSYFGLGSS